MVKVLVNGACGRMGQAVVKAVIEDKDLELVGAVDLLGGMDAGELVGTGKNGVIVGTDMEAVINEAKPEVMVDFTRPDVVFGNAVKALKLKVSPVIGTTGLSDEQKAELEKLANDNDTPVFIAPNFAIGAVLLMLLSREAAKYMPDVEIIELHHDKKLDALEDIIESANGKPILVAYWFKHDYQRIVARLNQIGVKYMKIDSDESITKWNNREIPVALIHPASAGHGLNLQQGGNTMVWFGITWSLELYQQCVCRLYRQGQSEGTVTIIHLISQGTIDEKIMKALSEKDNTQASLIDAVKAEI